LPGMHQKTGTGEYAFLLLYCCNGECKAMSVV